LPAASAITRENHQFVLSSVRKTMFHENLYGKVMFEAVRELHHELMKERNRTDQSRPEGLFRRIAAIWQRKPIFNHSMTTQAVTSQE
jgi:hypothetical protein